MWEAFKNLSKGAKAAIISGVVLLAAGGIGLGIWQPWKQPEEPPADEPDAPQQEIQEPQKEPQKGLSMRVDGEEVPCVLYEGDGWSIYVPEEWETEKIGSNGGLFTSGDGAQMSVRFENGGYDGSFVNLSANGTERLLQFYRGQGEGSPVAEGSAPANRWEDYDKLFVAMARSLTVGDEKPFEESYVIPSEPDWEKLEGMTVLFLDKDGYVVDDQVQEGIESFMRSWPAEDQAVYTGQYRINSLDWASRYTGIGKDGFIDVFRADVQYRLQEGAAPEGVSAVNGWASLGDGFYLAVSHDGGTVSKTQSLTETPENGWIGFAGKIA